MSMLAERKRKQKWSLNPRGKQWSEDSNKFGQKLLEKMGWSAGKGLGAKEDGITEHIRVYHKSDSKGMGYKETDDQWTCHESNFSQLLNSLSGLKGNEDTGKENEIKLESLEKKSQNSRARVHYHKFTRGKDLSRYSEKDLANIFGKKNLKEEKCNEDKETVQETNEENTKSFGVETHNRGNMLDYFKKKMSLNKKYSVNSEVKSNAVKTDSDEERPSFGFGFNGGVENKLKSSFVSYIGGNEFDNGITNTESKETKFIKKNRKLESIQEEIEEGVSKCGLSPKNNLKRKSGNVLEPAFTPLKKKFKNFESLDSLPDEENIEKTPTKKCKKKKFKKENLDEEYKKKSFDQIEKNGKTNPAFDPVFNPISVEKHSLEVIEEENEDFHEESPKKKSVVCETKIEQMPLKKKKKNKRSLEDITIADSKIVCNGLENPTFESPSNEVLVEKPVKVTNKEKVLQEEFSLKEDKSKKKKKSKMKEGIDNSCFEDFTRDSSFPSIEGQSNVDESVVSFNNEPEKKSKKSKKEKKLAQCDIEASADTKECENSEFRNNKKRKINVLEDHITSMNMLNDEKKKIKKKHNENCNENSQENVQVFQENNENDQDVQEKPPKHKKRKKDQFVAIENPCFNPDDSTECPENTNSLYEVKRKKKDVNLGIDNPGLDLSSPSKKKNKGKEVKPPLQLEMPIMDEEVMLNVVDTPVKKKEGETPVQKRKSVRFSGVNKRIFINKTDSPSDLLKNGSEGVDNEAYDELGNRIEENIDNLSKQLDDYQAQVENDINEAKIEVMVGEMGNPHGENEILPDGDVKLKFKYANFGKAPPWMKNNGTVNAKTSYRHLIKGDIVLGFKNTNLHEIKGYGQTSQRKES